VTTFAVTILLSINEPPVFTEPLSVF